MSRTTDCAYQDLNQELSSPHQPTPRPNYEEVVNHLHDDEMNDLFRAVDLFGGLDSDRNRFSDDEEFLYGFNVSHHDVDADDEDEESGIERGTDRSGKKETIALNRFVDSFGHIHHRSLITNMRGHPPCCRQAS